MQNSSSPPEKNKFTCKSCGALIEPPIVLPPIVLGPVVNANFQTTISYKCANPDCKTIHATHTNGKPVLEEIIIKQVEPKK